jgi:hypothetical protein
LGCIPPAAAQLPKPRGYIDALVCGLPDEKRKGVASWYYRDVLTTAEVLTANFFA